MPPLEDARFPPPTTKKDRGTAAQCAQHPEQAVLSYPIYGVALSNLWSSSIGLRSIRESEPERSHVHAAVAASGLVRLALLLVGLALVPTTAFARPRTAGSARLRRR